MTSLRRLIGSLVLFLSVVGSVFAEWELVQSPTSISSFPQVVAACSFQNAVYMSASSRVGTPSFWRSTDNGENWTRLTDFDGLEVEEMFVGDDALLYLKVMRTDVTPYRVRIYKTANGTTFTQVGAELTPAHSNTTHIAAMRGAYIYFYQGGDSNLLNSPEIYRIDVTAVSPAWESVATSLGGYYFHAGTDYQAFGRFKNGFYLLLHEPAAPAPQRTILTSSDAQTWTSHTDVFTGSTYLYAIAMVAGDHLYLTGQSEFSSCYRTHDVSVSSATWESVTFPSTFTYLFTINNLLAGVDATSRIWLQSADGDWSSLNLLPVPRRLSRYSSLPSDVLPPYFSVELNDRIFMFGSHIGQLKLGVVSVNSQATLATEFTSGQTDAVALSWTMPSNLEETISNVVVRNNGTATQSDIVAARIVRSSSLEVVAELEPGADSREWQMPTATSYSWSQNDEAFSLLLDISANAKDGATCAFILKSVDFSVNETYSYSGGIASSRIIPISLVSSSGPGALSEAIAYPQPAASNVTFMYTMTSVSDVEIKIFNRTGSLVSEIRVDDQAANNRAAATWDTSAFAPGVYYAHIDIKESNGTHRVYKKKVFVER